MVTKRTANDVHVNPPQQIHVLGYCRRAVAQHSRLLTREPCLRRAQARFLIMWWGVIRMKLPTCNSFKLVFNGLKCRTQHVILVFHAQLLIQLKIYPHITQCFFFKAAHELLFLHLLSSSRHTCLIQNDISCLSFHGAVNWVTMEFAATTGPRNTVGFIPSIVWLPGSDARP